MANLSIFTLNNNPNILRLKNKLVNYESTDKTITNYIKIYLDKPLDYYLSKYDPEMLPIYNLSLKQGWKFLEEYKKEYPNLPNTNFLTWLIGFVEGDGSFVISKTKNSLQFVITQSTEDIKILDYIKDNLGFGKVINQGERTSRFIVQDLKNLHLLILLFNGNIILPTRKNKFKEF